MHQQTLLHFKLQLCYAATRDRLQDLPRDQRQLAAADVALRIAAILGLNEESDDEESS